MPEATPYLKRAALCQIALFQELPAVELSRIEALLHPLNLPANAPLLYMNEVGESVFFVLSGTICIYRPQPGGGRFLLNILGAGETLGEVCALDNKGHSASAMTTEPSSLLRMRREDFRTLKSEIPSLALNMERLLVARLRFASSHNEALFPYDAKRGVARILLAFSERYNTENSESSVTIPLRLTQHDLSDLIGVSRQHISKNIQLLCKANCIQINSTTHRITVKDRAALVRHCF